jgi:hypothetical protein
MKNLQDPTKPPGFLLLLLIRRIVGNICVMSCLGFSYMAVNWFPAFCIWVAGFNLQVVSLIPMSLMTRKHTESTFL